MEMQTQAKTSFESSTLVIALGVGMAALGLMVIIQRHTRNKDNPPGPPGMPIIGHFHLLMMDRKIPTHQILARLSKDYGPIMHLRFGSRPVLVISSSKLAEECLSGTNDKYFASRPRVAAAKHLGYDYSMLGWAPYGQYWRNVRKICTLELLSSRRIQMFTRLRTDEICASVRSLFERSLYGIDEKNMAIKIKVRSVLSELMLNIILGMAINKNYFRDKSGALQLTHLIESSFFFHGALNLGDYIRCLRWLDLQGHEQAMKKALNLGDYIRCLRWLDLQGHEQAMKKLQSKIDSLLQRIVEEHRQNESESKTEQDFIDVLIAQAQTNDSILHKDAFVKATAMNMISAAVDTSSITMEWALALLLQHPQVLKEAQNELDTKVGRNRVVEESDIPELKYLQAIVKETLRLYPAGPLLGPHESVEPCKVGGFHVPAGTVLLVNAWAIHRDPGVWDNPLEFIPQRFLQHEDDTDMGNVRVLRRTNEFAMIPFGMGRRSCPGSSLALCIIHIVLARLLQSFDWFLPSDEEIDMTEGVAMTLPRVQPLEALVKPRLAHHLY